MRPQPIKALISSCFEKPSPHHHQREDGAGKQLHLALPDSSQKTGDKKPIQTPPLAELPMCCWSQPTTEDSLASHPGSFCLTSASKSSSEGTLQPDKQRALRCALLPARTHFLLLPALDLVRKPHVGPPVSVLCIGLLCCFC